MNLILCSAVFKKLLQENPKRVIPHIQRWQHDQVFEVQNANNWQTYSTHTAKVGLQTF